jgi:hypothetical protein
MSTTPLKPVPQALPPSVADLIDQRKGDLRRTLNDHVEELHLILYEDEKYKALLYAVWDEQAVEGSLAADNIMAAGMIRELAEQRKRPEVRSQKLATIAKCLGVVLRRYQVSRKERRNMLHGEVVPGDSGD